MSKRTRIFPHWFYPRFWGGSGPLYDEEVARYYYTGEDLERELVNIKYPNSRENELEHLILDKKFNLVEDEYEYEVKFTKLKYGEDSKEYKLACTEQDWTIGEIDDLTYEEKTSTIKEEPWVKVTAELIETDNGRGITISPRYNRYFIEYLKKNGYSPLLEEDELIRVWLNDFYSSIINGDEAEDNNDDFPI